MTFYTLVLLVWMNRGGAMTSIPGFPDRATCESAGVAFVFEAKAEDRPRFYCFANPERNGTR